MNAKGLTPNLFVFSYKVSLSSVDAEPKTLFFFSTDVTGHL